MRFVPWVLLLALTACGGGAGYQPPAPDPTPAPGGGGTTLTVTDSDLQYCVQAINGYRARAGRPALTRSAALEQFALAAATNDGKNHASHQYFQSTNGGGVASAENEIPWWHAPDYRSTREVIDQAEGLFFSEGPGGGHYENMVGRFTQAGCGFFLNGQEITMANDFR
jgi:hypothetical protein